MELDQNSFEILFKSNYKRLCNVALRIVNDLAIAENIVQDVFCRFWEKRHQLGIQLSVQAYLRRAVINESLNYLKKEQALAKRNEVYAMEKMDERNSTEDLLFAKDAQQQINLAINSLPPACKQVFLLSRFEKLSYKQIAETLNISVKTVENQVSKALKILRGQLILIFLYIFFELM
ncbi:RNA polymerase sigma-70 factor [Pelobium manganitolerans]|uniref:RNA polymerase sigma-70 factor n=1 Tax=Pelobium manganitolerans TaxID=1842495 RepID=UPI003FA39043